METVVRKLLLLIFFMTIPANLYSANLYTILTKSNSEINSELRVHIDDLTKEVFLVIKSGNSESLKKYLSKGLLEKISYDTSNLTKTLNPFISGSEFHSLNDYYCTVKKIGWGKKFTIVPSLTDDNSLIIPNIEIPGEHTFIKILKDNAEGFSHLLLVQYVKEGDGWKINFFVGADYEIDNYNAPKLVQKCNELYKQEKIASAVLYGLAAIRVLRPASYLQYKNENEYRKLLKSIFKEFNQKYHFPIEFKTNKSVQLFSIDLQVTKEGIEPVIQYLTPSINSSREIINNEASKLLPEVYDIFPDLKKSFPFIIMRAYKELPVDRNKQYMCFNSIFQNGKLIK
jgi:hypothetical protein